MQPTASISTSIITITSTSTPPATAASAADPAVSSPFSDVNKKITKVMHSIMDIILKEAVAIKTLHKNEIEIKKNSEVLSKLEPEITALRNLFKERHLIKRNTNYEIPGYNGTWKRNFLLSLQNRIKFINAQIEKRLKEDSPINSIRQRGINVHFKTLIQKIVTFMDDSSPSFMGSYGYSALKGHLQVKDFATEAENKDFTDKITEFRKLIPDLESLKTNSAERIRGSLIVAARAGSVTKLQALLNKYPIDLMRYFSRDKDDEISVEGFNDFTLIYPLFQEMIGEFCNGELKKEHFEVLEFLIEAGCDFREDMFHHIAYIFTDERRKLKIENAKMIIQFLFQKGVNPNETSYSWDPLSKKILDCNWSFNNLKIFKIFLDAKFNFGFQRIPIFQHPENGRTITLVKEKDLERECVFVAAGQLDSLNEGQVEKYFSPCPVPFHNVANFHNEKFKEKMTKVLALRQQMLSMAQTPTWINAIHTFFATTPCEGSTNKMTIPQPVIDIMIEYCGKMTRMQIVREIFYSVIYEDSDDFQPTSCLQSCTIL